MNETQDPLSELRDIHMPDAVSIWPLAPAWWWLGLGVLALLVAGYFIYKRFSRPNVQKAALAELDYFLAETVDQDDLQKHYMQLSILLRRFAISIFGNNNVAGLTGEKWLDFLDKTGDTDFFLNGPGRALITVPYGGTLLSSGNNSGTVNDSEEQGTDNEHDMNMLIDVIRLWVVKNT